MCGWTFGKWLEAKGLGNCPGRHKHNEDDTVFDCCDIPIDEEPDAHCDGHAVDGSTDPEQDLS